MFGLNFLGWCTNHFINKTLKISSVLLPMAKTYFLLEAAVMHGSFHPLVFYYFYFYLSVTHTIHAFICIYTHTNIPAKQICTCMLHTHICCATARAHGLTTVKLAAYQPTVPLTIHCCFSPLKEREPLTNSSICGTADSCWADHL